MERSYMLNIAFCDDDLLFLNKVSPKILTEIKKYEYDLNVKRYNSGEDLIQHFKLNPLYFDIVFLDIDMPVLNGKKVAQTLRSIDKEFKLIFLTAYEDEALNMFQYDTMGFLPKDKLSRYLPQTIERVMNRIEKEIPKIQFFQVYSSSEERKTVEIKVPLNCIIYFEVLNRKVYIHTIYGVYQLYHYQFGEIAKQFIQLGFLDIHRTIVVNAKYVISVEDMYIQLDNGEKLALSRRKRKKVIEAFMDDIYHTGGNIFD